MRPIKMIFAALLVHLVPRRVIAMALLKYSKEPERQTVAELFGEIAP